MTMLGNALHAFFEDHLKVQKGLRPASVRSYRDALKLFLRYASQAHRKPITRLALSDLSGDHVLGFLRDVEAQRGNSARTRNQRLAALRTFYRFLASHDPETLVHAQRVEAIPTKRCPHSETHYLERDDVNAWFKTLSATGAAALRDRALLTLLYNTGARAQEVSDLHVGDVQLDGAPRLRLHGKGDKWRMCPLWPETANLLRQLDSVRSGVQQAPLFCSRRRNALTRFGIYKLVRRHAAALDSKINARKHVSPHVFRHTTAMHLLESGVDVNVIRAWLGHVSLETTNRYAEITLRTKQEAVARCMPPVPSASADTPPSGRWRNDEVLIKWLDSL